MRINVVCYPEAPTASAPLDQGLFTVEVVSTVEGIGIMVNSDFECVITTRKARSELFRLEPVLSYRKSFILLYTP